MRYINIVLSLFSHTRSEEGIPKSREVWRKENMVKMIKMIKMIAGVCCAWTIFALFFFSPFFSSFLFNLFE